MALPREDRIAWFHRITYVQPLHFLKEINGTTYAVRPFFNDEVKENIVEKVQRIQIVDIHYSGVGILDELTPKERENRFRNLLQIVGKQKRSNHKGYTVSEKMLNGVAKAALGHLSYGGCPNGCSFILFI